MPVLLQRNSVPAFQAPQKPGSTELAALGLFASTLGAQPAQERGTSSKFIFSDPEDSSDSGSMGTMCFGRDSLQLPSSDSDNELELAELGHAVYFPPPLARKLTRARIIPQRAVDSDSGSEADRSCYSEFAEMCYADRRPPTSAVGPISCLPHSAEESSLVLPWPRRPGTIASQLAALTLNQPEKIGRPRRVTIAEQPNRAVPGPPRPKADGDLRQAGAALPELLSGSYTEKQLMLFGEFLDAPFALCARHRAPCNAPGPLERPPSPASEVPPSPCFCKICSRAVLSATIDSGPVSPSVW